MFVCIQVLNFLKLKQLRLKLISIYYMCKPFNSSTFYASVILLVVINLCTQLLNTTDSKLFIS